MKIRGNAIGTTMKPENNLVKANSLTDEQKKRVRKNFDAMQNGKADTDLSMNGHFIHNVSDGEEDNDAATVGQLNAAVGDIENALDRIIAIQESLIGGESA